MDTEELIEELSNEEDAEGGLDEAVHAAASSEASHVNNAGMEAQVNYLIERHGWGHEDILKWVRGSR